MVMIPNLAVVPDPNVNPSLGSVAFPDTTSLHRLP
jgi:hypothetical protein